MKRKLFVPCPDDPLRVRRHVALLCLAINTVALVALIGLAYKGGDQAAPILAAISINLGIILTGLIGMPVAWFHAAYRLDSAQKPAAPDGSGGNG